MGGRQRQLAGQALLALLGAIGAEPAQGAATICEPPADEAHVAVAWARQQRTEHAEPPGSIAPVVVHSRLQVTPGNGWQIGVQHRYTALREQGPALQSNGHLHNLYLPLHWHAASDRWRLSLAPAVSATSNVVKRPGRWSGTDVQLYAALIYRRTLSAAAAFRYGLCADYRFGRHYLYPAAAYEWTPQGPWRATLGFPESTLAWQPSPAWALRFSAAPAGNRWRAYDRDTADSAPLSLRVTELKLALDWQPAGALGLTLFAGRRVNQRIAARLADGSTARWRPDDAGFAGADLRWRF